MNNTIMGGQADLIAQLQAQLTQTQAQLEQLKTIEITVQPSDWSVTDNGILYPNQWIAKKLPANSSPTLQWCEASAPSITCYINDDSLSNYSFNADNYVGWFHTNVYCPESFSIQTSFTSDDNGWCYVNNVQVGQRSNTFTISFLAGWNTVDFIFQEGGGEDWIKVPLRLPSLSGVTMMAAELALIIAIVNCEPAPQNWQPGTWNLITSGDNIPAVVEQMNISHHLKSISYDALAHSITLEALYSKIPENNFSIKIQGIIT